MDEQGHVPLRDPLLLHDSSADRNVPEQTEQISPQLRRKLFVNVIVLSTAFFLLFSAYTTVQAFLSTLLSDTANNLGFESLSVVYVSYFLFMLAAGPIVEELGAAEVMATVSVLYVMYISALLLFECFPSTGTIWVLVGAALCGIGTSLMWVAQGVIISDWSARDERNRNRFVGIFWAGYQFSTVAGPFVAYFLVSLQNDPAKWFFGTFAAVGLISTLVFSMLLCKPCRLRPQCCCSRPQNESTDSRKASATRTRSCGQRARYHISRTFKLLFSRNGGLLSIASFFGGNLLCFSNGEFFCLARDTPCDRFDNLTSCQANNCTWFTTTTGNTSSVGSVPMLSNWRQSTNFLTATVAPHAETSWCAHEESVVSLALMAFGIGDVITALLLSWITQERNTAPEPPPKKHLVHSSIQQGSLAETKKHRRRVIVVALGCCGYAVALTLMLLMKSPATFAAIHLPNLLDLTWVVYVASALCGVADACINTQIYEALGALHRNEDSPQLFTIYCGTRGLGGVFGFGFPLIVSILQSRVPIYVQFGLCAAAFGSFCLLQRRKARCDDGDEN